VEKGNIQIWGTAMENCMSFLFNFARKAMLQVLPTAANLFPWKKTQDSFFPLCGCGKHKTNKHVLSNYSSPTALHRYTTRHNELLSVLVAWLRSAVTSDQQVYDDLPDAQVFLFVICSCTVGQT